ncbi:MAG: helix-turn-helix transcriptional regulator [Deltaproteobacteria bacterium]|nr:helix-turn-helix transcriptional regulator [Deltaproteobacteria bacterium]
MKKDKTEDEFQLQGKRERYIQPSILMVICDKPSYGYELIQNIHKYGFVEGQAPPGMIYRHLRQLEEEGLVSSEWETEGSGPAKRMYFLTDEGQEVLGLWIAYMEKQAENLQKFIERYREREKGLSDK